MDLLNENRKIDLSNNSTKRRSLRFSLTRQYTIDECHRRRLSTDDYGGSSSFRRTQSFKHKRKSRNIIYMPKSKMRMIKVTLSSPEKTPSPDLNDFDIDFSGCKTKTCTLKQYEKSYKFVCDKTTENKKYFQEDIIVKEKDKIVQSIPFIDLWAVKRSTTLQCHQMRLTTSPPERKLPDLRIFDYDGFLCEREMEFLKNRKLLVQSALKTFLGDDPLDNLDKIPHIALMGSGGGYRAMIAMSGIFNALHDKSLLGCILYMAALSGSSWYIATLYSDPDWPGDNTHPKELQKKIKVNIARNPKNLYNLLRFGGKWLYSKLSCSNWNLTMDAFGPLLAEALLPDRPGCKWSELAGKMVKGTVPLPLLAAIHAKEEGNAKDFHEWVEFSPFEVSIPKYGAAIDMNKFGSEFYNGTVTEKIEEFPLHQIMAICGSAFTATYEEMECKGFIRSSQQSEQKTDIQPETACPTDDDVFDTLDGPCCTPKSDERKDSTRKRSDRNERKSTSTVEIQEQLSSSNTQSKDTNERLQLNTDHSKIDSKETDVLLKDQMQNVEFLVEGLKDINLNTSVIEQGYDVLESFGSNQSQQNELSLSNKNNWISNVNELCFDSKKINAGNEGTTKANTKQGFDVVEYFGDNFGEYDSRERLQERNKNNNYENKLCFKNNERLDSAWNGKGVISNGEQISDDLKDFESYCDFSTEYTLPKTTNKKEDPMSESDEIELKLMFETICKVRKESGLAPLKEQTVEVGEQMLHSTKQTESDELDGCFEMYEKCKNWTVEQLTKSRKYRAGFVNNFLRKISFDGHPSLSSETNAFFENYLKKDMDKLCFIDAGLAFNSPYPLLLQPGREIDLILSFDFTDRKKDSNMPFQELLAAEVWARTHNVKFPKVKENIHKYENEEVKELYVFEDETDMDCPIIMHFVLVNNEFRKYKKPGEERKPGEYANFKVFDDGTTYNATTFHYTSDNFDNLSGLAEFIVLNNIEKIKTYIRKTVTHKISRTRKRHPTS